MASNWCRRNQSLKVMLLSSSICVDFAFKSLAQLFATNLFQSGELLQSSNIFNSHCSLLPSSSVLPGSFRMEIFTRKRTGKVVRVWLFSCETVDHCAGPDCCHPGPPWTKTRLPQLESSGYCADCPLAPYIQFLWVVDRTQVMVSSQTAVGGF